MSLILGRQLVAALAEAGIIPDHVSRVVIDIKTGDAVRVYCESYGTDELLKLVTREMAGSPVIMVKPGAEMEEVEVADLP